MAMARYNIGNTFSCAVKHIVSHIKCVGCADAFLGNTENSLVLDNDKGIYILPQFSNTAIGNSGFDPALKIKGAGHDPDRKNPHVAGDRGDHRSSAGSCPLSHSCRNKHKISTPKLAGNDFAVIFGRLTALCRISSRTKAIGRLFTDLNTHRSF